jgi:hypothetical protein
LFDKKNITAKYLKNIFGEIPADLSAEIRFLRNFLRIYLRNHVSWVISCGYYCGTTCGFFTGKFAVDLFLLLAENSAGKFPADFTNRRKQLPTSWEPKSAGKSAGKQKISSSVRAQVIHRSDETLKVVQVLVVGRSVNREVRMHQTKLNKTELV